MPSFRLNGQNNLYGRSYDDAGDMMNGPSRFLAPGDVPRAEKLQIFYNRDYTSAALVDFDGPLDDVGDPHVGPIFAKSPENETGEFLSDYGADQLCALFTTPGFEKSAQRLQLEGAGVNTDGLRWMGMTQAALDGIPVIPAGTQRKGGEWHQLLAGPLYAGARTRA